jgi:hypothetical protein
MTQPTLTTLCRRATEANATFKLAQIRLVRRIVTQIRQLKRGDRSIWVSYFPQNNLAWIGPRKGLRTTAVRSKAFKEGEVAKIAAEALRLARRPCKRFSSE